MSAAATGQPFEEVTVGDRFARSTTVTETHIVLAAGLFGDFAPLHVDEEYARESRFGTRIAHGTLTTGIMAAALSSLGIYYQVQARPARHRLKGLTIGITGSSLAIPLARLFSTELLQIDKAGGFTPPRWGNW